MKKIPQQEAKLELDITLTLEEIKKAIANLKCIRTPGINDIPPKVYLLGRDIILDIFTDLFTLC